MPFDLGSNVRGVAWPPLAPSQQDSEHIYIYSILDVLTEVFLGINVT